MQKYDLHVHSRFSQDASDFDIEEICNYGINKGMSGLAITDHFDLCYAPIGYEFYLEREKERQASFQAAKEKYKDKLEMLWGIEIGQPYEMPMISKDFLGTRNFDFVLGSVHFINNGQDIYLIECRNQEDADDLFKVYFEGMIELIRFGRFDSLAHLDYPVRIMEKAAIDISLEKYDRQIDEILKRIIDKDVALEINTRGLVNWENKTEPGENIVRRYFELGGRKITFGSDSHDPKYIGIGFDKAIAMAKKIGFQYYCVFKGRVPFSVNL